MKIVLPIFVSVLYASGVCADEFDCLIEARQTVEVRSPVEAVIESIRVRRGDYVKKGAVLVTLESGAERAALKLAQSRATMRGEIKAGEARRDLAGKKWQQAEKLYKDNFIAAAARDEAIAVLPSLL